MNLETILGQWVATCRELARRARKDAERAEAFDAVDPDATVRLVRRDAGTRTSE